MLVFELVFEYRRHRSGRVQYMSSWLLPSRSERKGIKLRLGYGKNNTIRFI